MSAYALEHFAEAAEEYEKAFTLKADAALLYNAAQAHRLAGNSDRALRLYRSYLRVFGRQASNRDEVDRHIAALERALALQQAAQESPPVSLEKPEAAPSAPVVLKAFETEAHHDLSTRSDKKPVYRKAWFWSVMGGVAVGIGVGLGVGLASLRRTDPTPSFGTTTVMQ